jgi:hypothetical protein
MVWRRHRILAPQPLVQSPPPRVRRDRGHIPAPLALHTLAAHTLDTLRHTLPPHRMSTTCMHAHTETHTHTQLLDGAPNRRTSNRMCAPEYLRRTNITVTRLSCAHRHPYEHMARPSHALPSIKHSCIHTHVCAHTHAHVCTHTFSARVLGRRWCRLQIRTSLARSSTVTNAWPSPSISTKPFLQDPPSQHTHTPTRTDTHADAQIRTTPHRVSPYSTGHLSLHYQLRHTHTLAHTHTHSLSFSYSLLALCVSVWVPYRQHFQ